MRLHKKFKKAMALAMVATTVTSTVVTATPVGLDTRGHWAEEVMGRWVERTVVGGYEDGTLRPNDRVTRAELAKMVSQIFGLSYINEELEYVDVAETDWFANDVLEVMSAGIMNTYEDGTFKPNQYATREEAVYALVNAYHLISETEEEMVETAEDVTELPLTALTDAIKVEFTDSDQISPWAVEQVEAFLAQGLLRGYEDGSIKPQDTLTRAEFLSFADRITADLVQEAGEYSKDIEGNLVINQADVILKDMVITGNLYLAEGIGDGDVTLDSVTVLGDVIVEGGGSETINIKGKTVIKNIIVNKVSGAVPRLLMDAQVVIEKTIRLVSSVVLEGNGVTIPKVVSVGAETVTIKGKVVVTTITISQTSKVELDEDVEVGSITVEKEAVGSNVTGSGKVTGDIITDAKDVELEVEVEGELKGEEEPTYKPPSSSSSSSSSGSTGGTTRPPTTSDDEEIEIESISLKLAGVEEVKEIEIDGAVNVEMTAETLTIEGVTLEADEAIESIQLNGNDDVKEVKVTLIGIADLELTLELNKAYTTAAIKEQVESQDLAEKAKARIDIYANNANLKEHFTPESVARLKAAIDHHYAQLLEDLQGENMTVASVIERFELSVMENLTANNIEGFKGLVEEYNSVLGLVGLEVHTLTEDSIHIEGNLLKVEDTTGEVDSKTHQVEMKYN